MFYDVVVVLWQEDGGKENKGIKVYLLLLFSFLPSQTYGGVEESSRFPFDRKRPFLHKKVPEDKMNEKV